MFNWVEDWTRLLAILLVTLLAILTAEVGIGLLIRIWTYKP